MGSYRKPQSPQSQTPDRSATMAQRYGISDQGWPYCPWPCTAQSTADLTEDWSEDSLRHLTQEAIRQQRYSGAIMLIDHLIQRHPHQASHYNNRGLIHLWCGHYVEALADFDQALHLNPQLDQAHNNRANAYAALGAFTLALADYDQALALNPFNTRARINLGVTWRDLGHLDHALVCFDEAILFHHLLEHSHAERGRTYHLRGDWNCALADYRRSLTHLSTQPPTADRIALQTRIQGWIDALLPPRSSAADP